ncbi:unnamed protein product [Paramecium pentaurelia]|uniref:Uncharacterized protein n=1 Tax=Paramecium pentaurelia TaxID=43138 RepID=A0A8S1V284_9CILI|nr:unnamed protein product [Paramecium pentaurelia]
MKSIQQVNSSSVPIGVQQIDTQLQKVKTLLDLEHQQTLERSFKESKLNKEFAQKLTQKVDQLQLERDKYKKQFEEGLKKVEGSGYGRTSFHSNKSDLERQIQTERGKQTDKSALQQILNEKGEQMQQEIECLKSENNQVTSDLRQAWQDIDQKEQLIKKLELQNSVLVNEIRKLQRKLQQEKLNNSEIKAVKQKDISSSQEQMPIEIQCLKNQINELQDEINEYQEMIDSQQQQIEIQKTNNSQLKIEKDNIAHKYAIANEKLQALFEEKDEMEKQKKIDNESLNGLQMCVSIQKENIKYLESEMKGLNQQLNQMKSLISNLEITINDLKNENLNLLEKLAEKPLQINLNLENEIANLQSASQADDDLLNKFNTLNVEYQNLNKSYLNLQSEYGNQQINFTNLEDQLKQQQLLNNKLNSDNDNLKKMIQNLENENKKLNQQNSELLSQINIYQVKDDENCKVLRKLNENIDMKNVENIRLKNKTKKQIGSYFLVLCRILKLEKDKSIQEQKIIKQQGIINDLLLTLEQQRKDVNQYSNIEQKQLQQIDIKPIELEEQKNLKILNQKILGKFFRLMIKQQQKDQQIKNLTQRLSKLKSINDALTNQSEDNHQIKKDEDLLEISKCPLVNEECSESLLNADELKKVKLFNLRLLTKLFRIATQLNQKKQINLDFERRLNKQKAINSQLQIQIEQFKAINKENDLEDQQKIVDNNNDYEQLQGNTESLKNFNRKLLVKCFRNVYLQQKLAKENLLLNNRINKLKAQLNETNQENIVTEQSKKNEYNEIQNITPKEDEYIQKISTQELKYLSKWFKAMCLIKSKNSVVDQLNQKLAKQKAINEELREQIKMNEEDVENLEVKEKSEEQEEQSVPLSQDDGEGQKKLRSQNNKLLGKLFRVMSQFNKKNNEIEELKERLHKQKAILDELSNQNNASISEEKGDDLGKAEEIELNQEVQQIPDVEQLKKQKLTLFGKLFRAMSLINQKNKEIESLSDRLNKQKAIIEELTSSNSENLAIEMEPQQIELQSAPNNLIEDNGNLELNNTEEFNKLKTSNDRSLSKLFRAMFLISKKNNQIEQLNSRLLKQKAIIEELAQNDSAQQQREKIHKLLGKLFRAINSLLNQVPQKEEEVASEIKQSDQEEITMPTDLIQRLEADQQQLKNRNIKLTSKMFKIMIKLSQKDKLIESLSERLLKQKAINDELRNQIVDSLQPQPQCETMEIVDNQQQVNADEFNKIKNSNSKSLAKIFRLVFKLNQKEKIIDEQNQRIAKLKQIISEYALNDDTLKKVKDKNHKLLAQQFRVVIKLAKQQQENEELKNRLSKSKQLVVEQQDMVENLQQQLQSNVIQNQEQDVPKEQYQEQLQGIDLSNKDEEIQTLIRQKNKQLGKLFKIMIQLERKNKEIEQLSQRLLKQKAINDELLLQNSSDETEVSSYSSQKNQQEQVNVQNNSEMKDLQEENDKLKQELKKQTNQNNRWLAKLFRALNCIKSRNSLVDQLNQKLAKQKAINEELREQIKMNEEDVENLEVKEKSEEQEEQSVPLSQDDGEGQKKLRSQNNKLLGKLFRVMSQFNKKNNEIEELKERLHKQKAILDELSNQNNASISEEKGDDLGKAEEIELNQEVQQIPDVEQLKKQKLTLFGKLFRAMSLINQKNKEIESLSDRLNKQKAIIEELTSSNSENLAIEMEPQQIELQSAPNNLIEDNGNLELNNTEEFNKLKTSNDRSLSKLFRAMFLISKKNNQIEQLNSRLLKQKAIIEELAQNDSAQQQREKIHKLLGKLFRAISDLNMKQKQNEELKERLSKSKALVDSLLNQVPQKEEEVASEIKQSDQEEITMPTDLIQRLEADQQQLKNRNIKLTSKMFKIMIKLSQKDKLIESLSERLLKQKAINDELRNQIVDSLQPQPQCETMEIVDNQQQVNADEFNKIKNSNSKSLAKIFRLVFKLNQKEKIIDEQNQRIAKLKQIISEYALNDDTLKKVKDKNHKLLAQQFRVVIKLAKQQQENEELKNRLSKSKQLVVEQQDMVENLQQQLQSNVIQNQEQDVPKEQYQEQLQGIDLSNKDEEIQTLIRQKNKQLGKLFKIMIQLERKNKEIEQLSQRLLKQKAINDELLLQNSSDETEVSSYSSQKNQQEQVNVQNNSEMKDLQEENDKLKQELKKQTNQNNRWLAKLFRALNCIKSRNSLVDQLNQKLAKQKAINEELREQIKMNEEDVENLEVKEKSEEQEEQSVPLSQDDGEGQKKLRSQNNKLLGKLFRVMSQFNKKNNEIEELKERLHKQKAILDELSNQNNASISEEKGDDLGKAEEIELNQEVQQIPDVEQLKKQKLTLFGKLFRAMSLINQKNKEIESLSDRLNKQKAIIEELTSSNSENLAIEMEPQQIELQSAPNNLIEDNGNLELNNTEEFNKLKTSNDRSLSKLFRAMFLISKKNNQIEQLNSRLLKQKAIIEELAQNDSAQQQREKIHKLLGKLFRAISDLNMKQKQNEELKERLSKSKALVDSLLNQVPQKEEEVASEIKQSDQEEITMPTDLIQRLEADQQQLKNRNIKLTSKMFKIMIKLSQKDKLIESLSERLLKQKAINDELRNQIVDSLQPQPQCETMEIVDNQQQVNADEFNKIKNSNSKSLAKIFRLVFKLNQKEKIIDEQNQRIAKLKQIISEYALNDDTLKKVKDKNHKLLAQQFRVVIKLAKQQQENEELKNRLSKSKQLVVEQQDMVENLQQQLQSNVIQNQEQDVPKEQYQEQLQGIDLSNKDEEIQTLIRQKNKQLGKLFKIMIQLERKNKEIEQLSQRLLKQKAINDELLLQNSSDETEVSSYSSQKNQQEQVNVQNNSEMKDLQEENDKLKQELKKQTNQNNRWLAKLFRALNCIKSRNSLVDQLNQKLAKQKAINEELREQIKMNEEDVENLEVKEKSEEQEEQSVPLSQDDGEGQKKLRSQNNKLLGKLFRVMSQFNKKNNEIEELKERLHKQKAILDELSNQNNASISEEKGDDLGKAEEIELNQEVQQIPDVEQLKKQKLTLFGKLFRAMSLINQKNKEIESLSDRLNKQKAIIEELTSSNSENLAIEMEPQQIELQSAPNNLIEDNGNLELNNTEEFNKLKTSNDRSLSKLFRAMFLISKKNNQIEQLNSRLLKQKAIIEELAQNDSAQQQREKIHKLLGKLFRAISDLNMKQKQNEELKERLSKSKALVDSLLNQVPQKEEEVASEIKQSDQEEITMPTDLIQRLEADQQQLKNRNIKLTSKMFKIMIKLSQKDKLIESLSERLLKQKAINDELRNQIVDSLQPQPQCETMEIVDNQQQVNADEFNKIKNSNSKSLAKIFRLVFKLNQKEKIIDEQNQRIAKLKQIISEYALNDDTLKKVKDKNHKLLAQQFRVVIKLAKQQQENEELKNRLSKSKQLVVEQQDMVENLQQQLQSNVIQNQEQDVPKEQYQEQLQGIDLSNKDEEIQTLIRQKNKQLGKLFKIMIQLERKNKEIEQLSQRLLKQKAINDELLLQNSSDETEVSSYSSQKNQQEQVNVQNNSEMKDLQEENDKLKQELKKQTNQNNRWLAKLFRALNCIKSRNSLVDQLNQKLAKQKAINEELREQIKMNEEDVENLEVKEKSEEQEEQSVPLSQDDGEGQKKLRSQNNKLLGKLFRVMSQFNKKNNEIEELKERLHKQKAILDELSNQNNASISEEKGDDLGKAEEIELNQEVQQIPDVEQLKKQKLTLFGKLFRAMSLINQKNKEIESLSDRLNKQKAIIEELTSSNSENLAIEMEPQQIELQSAPNNLIEDNGNLELNNTEEFNKLKTSNDRSLSKLFRAMFLISKKNNQIEQLNSRLLKQKAIIEELAQNDSAQQQREKIHKLLGKLFRAKYYIINSLQKENDNISQENIILKLQYDALLTKCDTLEQKFNDKIAQFYSLIEQLLKQNQDDIEENNQLNQLTKASSQVIKFLHKQQQDQNFENTSSSSSFISVQDESQKQIMYLQHQVMYLQHSVQEYADGISQLNRRILELYYKNNKLEALLQESDIKKCFNL